MVKNGIKVICYVYHSEAEGMLMKYQASMNHLGGSGNSNGHQKRFQCRWQITSAQGPQAFGPDLELRIEDAC